jgi:hypothetical protein
MAKTFFNPNSHKPHVDWESKRKKSLYYRVEVIKKYYIFFNDIKEYYIETEIH